jgi:osmotically-inducible protein OsmY
MQSSQRFYGFAFATALGSCLAISPVYAQDLKTDVVPANAELQSAPAAAASGTKTTHSSVALDKDSAATVQHHRYNSDAERAQDDLLITEVKSALAEDGISNGYPVEVDADHGTVTLSGVVKSADDVKAAAGDAAAVRGVVAVKNQLQPHKSPIPDAADAN